MVNFDDLLDLPKMNGPLPVAVHVTGDLLEIDLSRKRQVNELQNETQNEIPTN